MLRSLIAATASAALLLPALASAQDGRLTVPQIKATGSAAEPVAQVSSRSRLTELPQRAEPPSPAASPQLSAAGDGGQTSQLTASGQSARQPVQLYSGGRTAQPSQPLSRPAEGRTGAGTVTPVMGNDRCDAAVKAQAAEACERVLETRSAEFARPDPIVLSPEQRLLVEQRLREAPNSARTAARRLAGGAADADAEEVQGVASVVLRPSNLPAADVPVAEQDTIAAEAAAIVNAIMNAGGGAPRP